MILNDTGFATELDAPEVNRDTKLLLANGLSIKMLKEHLVSLSREKADLQEDVEDLLAACKEALKALNNATANSEFEPSPLAYMLFDAIRKAENNK